MPGKRLLLIFINLLILIPIASLLISQRIKHSSPTINNYDRTVTNQVSDTSISSNPLKNLLQNLEGSKSANQNQNSTPAGPTLSLTITLEGRPLNDQHTKLFVGITQGSQVSVSPQYLISTSLDIPPSGVSNSISLLGLTPGTTYTAVLKSSAQIATSSAFFMTPSGAKLNQGQPITLTTGDLNEDNIIDQSDVTILQNSLGATSSSKNWNPNLDFNLDGIINLVDLGILQKNLGKAGATGKWYSPTPLASQSASLPGNIGGESILAPPPSAGRPALSEQSESKGYWLWIPQLSP